MRSKDKSSISHQQPTSTNTPLSQRRLKTKPTLILLAILLVGNLFWFILWLLPSAEKDSNEQVAVINGEEISRQQWLAAMEERYGKETLQNLVNEKVMAEAAEEFKIKVTDEEIDFELLLIRSAQDANDSSLSNLTEKQLRSKIKNQLILEKVLTKDLVISDEEIETYYTENKSMYNIPTTYDTSMIVVSSEEEAQAVLKELKDGSDFQVVAREKSMDRASASLGGSIGFISEDQQSIEAAIVKAAASTEVKQTSKPFLLSNGTYALVHVNEVVKGQSFKLKDAKNHIQRTIAMEQLPSTITTETFWSEFNVEWFYGESK
jgi:foldase protein PrsA